MTPEHQKYIDLLRREVKPALGCTEPIAVALAVARSCEAIRETGEKPIKIEVFVSANILKNGMGVGIPGAGMVGLHIASALGAVCGKSKYKLEVLNDLDDDALAAAKSMVDSKKIDINLAETDLKLYIRAISYSLNHSATTLIQDIHDNIVYVKRDDEMLEDNRNHSKKDGATEAVEEQLGITVRAIHDFATTVPFEEIAQILDAGRMNKRIALEGLRHDYGLQVGKTIYNNITKQVFGNGILTYSMALTAAASDARMAGSILPAMSNSGSGNQGITATLPVVAVAEKMGSSDEQLARALVISSLVSIHIKQSLGRLSALCGCVVASSGSSCGIVYLCGGGYDQMTYSIKNMIGNVTGMVCDGAKVGCALKVSSGVSASVQAAMLAMQDICISDNDGIIEDDIEKTIYNLSTIGNTGMASTDKLMLDIMVNKNRNKIRCL